MPPKKRDRSPVDEIRSHFEQVQDDHEMFLQAFESKRGDPIYRVEKKVQNGFVYSFRILLQMVFQLVNSKPLLSTIPHDNVFCPCYYFQLDPSIHDKFTKSVI